MKQRVLTRYKNSKIYFLTFLGFFSPSERYPQDFQLKDMGTHCVHVGSAVHPLRTCLFTELWKLTHSYMPDDIVGRAQYSALPSKTSVEKYLIISK